MDEQLAGMVKLFDPNLSPDADGFRSAMLLIALVRERSWDHGRLARLVGRPLPWVRERMTRLRRNGVIEGHGKRKRLNVQWFDKEAGGIAFWCDTCVADGLLERARA